MSTSGVTTAALYQNAKRLATGKVQLEMSMGQIMVLLVLGIFYIAVSSMGIKTYNNCSAVQSSKSLTNTKHFLAHTLTMALTIPFTLLAMKSFSKDLAFWMTFYGIMGLVGSAMTVHFTRKCDNAKKSAKNFAGLTLAMFIFVLLGGLFMFSKKAKVNVAV